MDIGVLNVIIGITERRREASLDRIVVRERDHDPGDRMVEKCGRKTNMGDVSTNIAAILVLQLE